MLEAHTAAASFSQTTPCPTPSFPSLLLSPATSLLLLSPPLPFHLPLPNPPTSLSSPRNEESVCKKCARSLQSQIASRLCHSCQRMSGTYTCCIVLTNITVARLQVFHHCSGHLPTPSLLPPHPSICLSPTNPPPSPPQGTKGECARSFHSLIASPVYDSCQRMSDTHTAAASFKSRQHRPPHLMLAFTTLFTSHIPCSSLPSLSPASDGFLPPQSPPQGWGGGL